MFVNPEQDNAICDVCVSSLYNIVARRYAQGNPYQPTDGRLN
jgi:hypothetical protein